MAALNGGFSWRPQDHPPQSLGTGEPGGPSLGEGAHPICWAAGGQAVPSLGLRVGGRAGHSWYGVMRWGVWAAGRTGEWGARHPWEPTAGLPTRAWGPGQAPLQHQGTGVGRGAGASRGPTPSHLSFPCRAYRNSNTELLFLEEMLQNDNETFPL